MQTSQEYFTTIAYAKFGGQTECIMDNWKIVNTDGRIFKGIRSLGWSDFIKVWLCWVQTHFNYQIVFEFYFILPLKMWFSNVQFFKVTTWILLHAFCAYCITCCPITESSCRVFCGSIFTGHQHTKKIAWKLNQATATIRLVFVSSAPALTDGFGFSEDEKSSKRRDEFTNE